MKFEELILVAITFFMGVILSICDLVFYKIFNHLGEGHPIYPSLISIWASIFWIASIYLVLKYTGLIGRKKHG